MALTMTSPFPEVTAGEDDLAWELNDRLRANDPDLIRLDLTGNTLEELSPESRNALIDAVPYNETVKTVHISGTSLEEFYETSQVERLLNGIGSLKSLEELCVFRGGSRVLTEDMLSKCLVEKNMNIKIMMLWGFVLSSDRPALAGAIRSHSKLERLTITLQPNHSGMDWSALDVYVMGMAAMPNLKVLQIRCQGRQRQSESLISPEAMSILFNSQSIETLYLENLGLLDDHIDAIVEDLSSNFLLHSLDMKGNLFTDDAIYTMSRILPKNDTLESLDLSGVLLSEGSGRALAAGLAENSKLTYLELEGEYSRFQDEFDIPPGHSQTEWMQAIDYQIRLNRAGKAGGIKASRKSYVEALNSVSDHLGCLFHFVRSYPEHCDRILQEQNKNGLATSAWGG